MNIEIIDQGLGTCDPFQEFLLRLLEDESFTCCNALIAFVTYDGLLRLGPEPGGVLHRFVTTPAKKLHWIIGADTVTTAEALAGLRDMQTLAGAQCLIQVLEDPTGRLFHPKVFMFERSNGGGAVLVGSNNLTPGGLQDNIETAVLLDDISPEEMESWRQVWLRVSQDSRLRPITDDLIVRVRHDRQRRHISRRRIRITEETGPEIAQGNPMILIRYIAGAGGRTSQVHFTRHIVERYFGLCPGDGKTINVQMVQPGQSPGHLEVNRRLVFSKTNRNPKIEMDGLKDRLPSDYPTDWHAILLVQRVEPGRYRYMTLLPTDPGYAEVNNHLSQVPRYRLALQEDIIPLDRLLEIWPDYPV
jgi:hypothetical protein